MRQSYWKKLTPSPSQRKVVALEVHPALPERLEMPGQRGRAEPRKRDKLVDEMGLVEESTVGRQVTPLRRGGPPHERQRAVKPLHAVEPLGGETDRKST